MLAAGEPDGIKMGVPVAQGLACYEAATSRVFNLLTTHQHPPAAQQTITAHSSKAHLICCIFAVTLAGSRGSPTTPDFIDQLITNPAEAEAETAALQSVAAVPPAPRLQPKKAAAGVQPASDSQLNQLLVSMTQAPAPAPAGPQQQPQPQPRRRRRKVPPSPSPKPQQQQQQTQADAGPRTPPVVVDDFVCPPGIICAQSGSKICGNCEWLRTQSMLNMAASATTCAPKRDVSGCSNCSQSWYCCRNKHCLLKLSAMFC
jgi:hypothetical protein